MTVSMKSKASRITTFHIAMNSINKQSLLYMSDICHALCNNNSVSFSTDTASHAGYIQFCITSDLQKLWLVSQFQYLFSSSPLLYICSHFYLSSDPRAALLISFAILYHITPTPSAVSQPLLVHPIPAV